MRQARIVLENREALYYLCNEIKLELPNLKAKDKALLEVTIFQTAEFCKIDILSYTIHNRGYAMLIRIPKPEPIEEEKLIASVKRYCLYSYTAYRKRNPKRYRQSVLILEQSH